MTVRANNINDLVEEIGKINESHGFREDWNMASWLEGLVEAWSHDDIMHTVVSHYETGEDVTIGDTLLQAAQIIRNNILGMKIALITSELSEALETLRKCGATGILTEPNWGEELADAEIRIKDLADMTKVDLGTAEIEKMATNANRPYKHGKKI